MGSLFKQSKLLFWTVEIVLTIIGVFFLLKMPNIFTPIFGMVSAVFMPLLIAGFLYYMFDPIVVFLEKRGLPRIGGFLLSFAILVVLIALVVMNVVPQLVNQSLELSQSLPSYAEEMNQWLNDLGDLEAFKGFNIQEQLDKANITISNILNFAIVGVTNSLSKIVGLLMRFFILLFTVPFILFFMFKDGHKFLDAMSHFFPKSIRSELRQTVRELNQTLSAYISSTVLDALIIGILSFIAMTIFKQPYALLLAVFCGLTNIIPYVGPFIGAVPAILVGLFISPWQALYMALSILVIQQLDGNLIKPLLMGKSLNIHPLTIILVLIASGSVGGIIGMLICIPVYAVIKTLVLNIGKIYRIKKGSTEKVLKDEIV
ncbi:AI-2E family transporter [Enterococcus caccae]|uniref:Pheromone autoinducer 2 transporter n=1 Tax=Enterococcus caccae ATCC BAA-1240 TaxID=1158612 RepID=R3X5S4_9ENTE|nr:AI-2E family transporter [Enterococcus caccae]EOL49400.1 pheromone autoinducer 2 transporter [Enterococcus caccae ATCC BAA-1240]EOT56452.1 pheromone autoinducer 2 transporter [Enterococcus caccae ATCC BAA-1240]